MPLHPLAGFLDDVLATVGPCDHLMRFMNGLRRQKVHGPELPPALGHEVVENMAFFTPLHVVNP